MITRRTFFAQATALAFVSAIRAAVPSGKTILLRSAWDTVNIGDIAITPGTLRIFEKQLPDGTIVAATHASLTPKENPSIVSVRFKMSEVDALAAKLTLGSKQ